MWLLLVCFIIIFKSAADSAFLCHLHLGTLLHAPCLLGHHQHRLLKWPAWHCLYAKDNCSGCVNRKNSSKRNQTSKLFSLLSLFHSLINTNVSSSGILWGFPGGSDGKESTCQCRRPRFDRWIAKIPWRREWQPTPVFLPGESHEQRRYIIY